MFEKKKQRDKILEENADTSSLTEEVSVSEKQIKNEFVTPPSNVPVYYRPGEYAYAELVQIGKDRYHFLCVDEVSHFWINKSVVDTVYPNIKLGDYIWVQLIKILKSESNYRYIPSNTYRAFVSSEKNIGREIRAFAELHKPGDLFLAPIKEVDKKGVMVSIGKDTTLRVKYKHLPLSAEAYRFKPGKVRCFRVKDIIRREEDDGRIKHEIQIMPELVVPKPRIISNGSEWNYLPQNFEEEVNVYALKMEYLLEREDVCNAIFGETPPTTANLRRFLAEKYREECEKRQIRIQFKNVAGAFMDFSLGIRDKNGIPQSACFRRAKNQSWKLSLIGFSKVEEELERYVFVPNMSLLLIHLSSIAKPEEWHFRNSDKEPCHILKMHFLFTFFKAKLDGYLVEKDGYAVFNTGLKDSSENDVYCVLKPNTFAEDFYMRKWEYDFFACKGIGENGRRLEDLFPVLPQVPEYIDKNRTKTSVFQPDADIVCDFHHFFFDNFYRFPLSFLDKAIGQDEEIHDLIEEYKKNKTRNTLSELRFFFSDENEKGVKARINMEQEFLKALEVSRREAEKNPELAIPIYYAKINDASILLPIWLEGTPDSSPVSVALILEWSKEGYYLGKTIYTPQMAYPDARQLGEVKSEWLSLEKIIAAEETDEEENGDSEEE